MPRAAAETQALIGKTLGGRFVVERLLGEGGMGAVYAAQEVNTQERVALKVVHAELAARHKEHVSRFVQETLAAALVNHPNVVRSLGAFDDEGRPVLVLELLEGISLDRVIRKGPLPIARAVEIALQASEGIGAAHAKGIVHRDLKPANVFLTEVGERLRVVVLDFGVALLHDPLRDPQDIRQTAHGVLLGTLDYMSPEQLQDARTADARSDVYALGVILFEMLTGRVPFSAETDPMLVVQILTAPHLDVSNHRPDVPAELVGVVDRALAKDPARRFQSMAEFAAALRAFQRDASPEAASPLAPLGSPGRSNLLQWIVIVVLAVVAITAALMR
ncbi:MAG TPA: serine/threonine-protein kinase [Polyangiaceae bacterium]|nr:serine/threonine-protein kinase [Polyangiaceae bacterium]